MPDNIIERELSYQIINAAFTVHNHLGPGFLESIYEAAMAFELADRGFLTHRQLRIPVLYRQSQVGEHVLDMVVEH